MGLTTAELAGMRDSIELLLPDTCTILSISRTADGEGGFTETLGTVGTAIPCRVDVKHGRFMNTAGAMQPYMKTQLSLAYDQTITEAHRVVHGGVTYSVIAPPNSDQSWIAVKRVELERI
jgi:head-tail adaptor